MAQPPEQTEKPVSQAHITQRLSQGPTVIGDPATPALRLLDRDMEGESAWMLKTQEAMGSFKSGGYDIAMKLVKGHLSDPECRPLFRLHLMVILAI
jgi:hypothetical protein